MTFKVQREQAFASRISRSDKHPSGHPPHQCRTIPHQHRPRRVVATSRFTASGSSAWRHSNLFHRYTSSKPGIASDVTPRSRLDPRNRRHAGATSPRQAMLAPQSCTSSRRIQAMPQYGRCTTADSVPVRHLSIVGAGMCLRFSRTGRLQPRSSPRR
ncbi:hypothetical protein VFPFJ_09949 [Purpureocillium lilacinum]|uniref:Uncharacterized protein n=1 Tax=Purpureocillium lilacinum TaxID=33203 RepID=A0A179GQ63_PURLI|nr:hypothetical protein VFPFJ_09949 [Purpureocillium lilacinum]OAQ76381.1 hypothetical protein VFPBJ_08741 [Purpureocillium lilacinum]OAQ79463.1 hypothetical protein VFPFJ_09949 [Purpureocillium lilacinum]